MSKSASELSKKLIGHISYIEKTRTKTEKLFAKGELVSRDVDLVYYGLYLELITSFERFIEDLFIGLLSETVEHSLKAVSPKLTFKSSQLCRSIIVGERSYVDWLPYHKYTLKRADAFFTKGLPFSSLTKSEKKSIDNFAIIRNALAHKSKHSLEQFENTIIVGLPLTKREKTPTGYLRSNYIGLPNPQTRFEEIEMQISNISKKLAK